VTEVPCGLRLTERRSLIPPVSVFPAPSRLSAQCLFIGSERAGCRAAAIQSLFAIAKLNGLDPACWLADVLERLPTCPNSQIDSLLPFPDFIQI
jgi:hypothetical protein